MHALSHSFAHRGPSASRARSRWQPYTCNLTSASNCSPASYLHTPASSISSSSPASAQISPITHIDRPRKNACQPNNPLITQGCYLREAQKNKYVTRLVDQAVKSLGEIWDPEDIPQVFRTQSRTGFGISSSECNVPPCEMPLFTTSCANYNTQLPSPVSPTTHPSPITASPVALLASAPHDPTRSNHLIPIRGFVHEVLRRSRTSTGVLQTALCYLEAVRAKIPELLRKENANISSTGYATTEDLTPRITVATPEECAADAAFSFMALQCNIALGLDRAITVNYGFPSAPITAPQTELVTDISPDVPIRPDSCDKTASLLTPLPPIPSPLLCPRRTFLACLILASKFLQDRSYSNKAWAKLAGLPPREIGRCERALGEALEWRLWVGKGPAPTSVPVVNSHRAVVRCRSESLLKLPTCPAPATPAYMYVQQSVARPSVSNSSGLRRSSTMPNIGLDNDSGFQYGSSSLSMVGHNGFMPPSCVAPTVLVEGPSSTFEEPVGIPSDIASFIPFELGHQGRFLTARDVVSPSLSTPTLGYSPMSTASTASSDDGDRQFNSSMDASSTSYYSRVDLQAECESKPMGPFDSMMRLGQSIAGVKLAPIMDHHAISRPPVLPPISEAVFNPVLLEHGVRGTMSDGMGVGVSVYPGSVPHYG